MEANSYTIVKFLDLSWEKFYSNLSNTHHGDHNSQVGTQSEAWECEFYHLKETLNGLKDKGGRIIFEYRISGFQKVIDVILLYKGKIFVVEYKCGATEFNSEDVRQVNGYTLRLKYFHSKSNDNWIVPILVATEAETNGLDIKKSTEDKVYRPIKCNKGNLIDAIECVNEETPYNGGSDWENDWENGIYKASPTIIEAARNVWRKNNVRGFQHEDDTKGKLQHLNAEKCITEIINETKNRNGKSICFVTGVPGAGKTLVGLNISVAQQSNGASLLSGNGPLVSVLSTALKRDLKTNKKNVYTETKEISIETIIRGAYEYKKEIIDKRLVYDNNSGKISKNPDAENSSLHVVIFDEAQRAWTQEKLIKKGQSAKKYWQEKKFPFSEPALLLWDMNNIHDWGVFICLVGGGQEINEGEAGICEWLSALKNRDEFKDWHIYMADAFQGKEYDSIDGSGETIKSYRSHFSEKGRLHIDNSLHLTECQRSIRSSKVSDFINSMLDCDAETAKKLYLEIKDKFHIHITRDINKAKQHLRDRKADLKDLYQEDQECKIGMLMSSNAERLRPLGFPKVYKPKVDHWFLDDENNVNSSDFLEIALEEFSVQGLELDMTAVMWDADMRYNKKTNSWSFYKFNNKNVNWSEIVDNQGPKNKVESESKRIERERKNRVKQINRSYMLNAYRVLLTRGRTDMVIVVPEGDKSDKTRSPKFYDCTYEYLKSLGIEEL